MTDIEQVMMFRDKVGTLHDTERKAEEANVLCRVHDLFRAETSYSEGEFAADSIVDAIVEKPEIRDALRTFLDIPEATPKLRKDIGDVLDGDALTDSELIDEIIRLVRSS